MKGRRGIGRETVERRQLRGPRIPQKEALTGLYWLGTYQVWKWAPVISEMLCILQKMPLVWAFLLTPFHYPLMTWVNNRVFFCIPKASLTPFNAEQAHLYMQITQNGGWHHDGGRWWYHAGHLADGRIIESDKDMAFPIKDLSGTSLRSTHDAELTYCIDNIDRIAALMGILWEKSKDTPFGTKFRYIGLNWDILEGTVSLSHDKREKYHTAILEWLLHITHVLDKVQSLYSKLLHSCQVIPARHAYTMWLEIFMGKFYSSPF
jgi:hypothetical protein